MGAQVMIVAAEASSALFALRLLEYWKKSGQNYHAFGVGTKQMEDIGFERIGKSEEMAVVGAAEIIEAYSHLKGVFDQLVLEAEKRQPKVVIVMDYPEFNLMLARKLHKLGLPVVYYVSPQVWAWRKGRVETIKKYCKKVLVLFPFEVPFYQEKNVPVEFVGHPVLDELDDKYFSDSYRKLHRERYGIKDDEIVLGLMPGSRRGELKQHIDIQIEVARRLYKTYSNIRVLFMVAPTLSKEQVIEKLADVRFPYLLLKEEPFEMIHLADLILVASGTASLMVALLEKPMVIMYKMKFLTGIFAKIFVRGVKYFGLPNLISGREVVPERWQGGTEAMHLYELLKKYIDDPHYQQQVRDDLKKIKFQLGDKGATFRVDQALREFLK